MQPCSKTGEISGPNIFSHLLTTPHFSLFMCFTLTQSLVPLFPLALPNFLLDVNKEKYDFLFIQKTARNETENSSLSTNNTWHRPHPVLRGCHTRADILQAATSGATVLKAGVGWGPAVTVYESYVCVFSALIPGQSPV